jgi:hypothetical protein
MYPQHALQQGTLLHSAAQIELPPPRVPRTLKVTLQGPRNISQATPLNSQERKKKVGVEDE